MIQLETEEKEIFARLAELMPSNQIKEKPGQGDSVQHYVKVQSVMNRLDEVLGPMGWWDEYRVIDEATVECALTVRMSDGRTITKRDVGERRTSSKNAKDAGLSWKTAYSDSLKRAASKFGVGRHLAQCGVAEFVVPTLIELGRIEDQAAKVENRRSGVPRDGQKLFDWIASKSTEPGLKGLAGYMARWAEDGEYPEILSQWTAEMVAEAHEEACRKISEKKSKLGVGSR